MDSKRQRGAYFTTGDPFQNDAFEEWATRAHLKSATILEPFAGGNNLIDLLVALGWCTSSRSFDIQPASDRVEQRDTLKDFPTGYSVCVTNPPWLAKNSATRRGMPYPDTKYQDIYLVALHQCLANCDFVAALVPESFIRTGLFTDRLRAFVSLPPMFEDTDSPVGLALFYPHYQMDTQVFIGGKHLGGLRVLAHHKPGALIDLFMEFNCPTGGLGLIAVDNTQGASIRFCRPCELGDRPIKHSSRAITRIDVEDGHPPIDALNCCLDNYRKDTHDVFLTSFKGLRRDGLYRRRLDWDTARLIINHVSEY